MDTFIAIMRSGPTRTTIELPSVAARDGVPLHYTDWSTSVVSKHEISFILPGSETMKK
jgi:hypothetical protein